MDKVSYGLVEEFMRDYCVTEYEARKALAEMYYHRDFEYGDREAK